MLNVAVVGLGWWGRIIVKTLADSTRLKVVAGVESNETEGRAFCEQNRLRYVPTLEQALAQSDIHAVILTTPNTLHEPQVIMSAQAGKHVFCEKPLAFTVGSAARSIDACVANNVRLGLGHERRFDPPTLQILQMIQRGDLGRLIQIEANFSQNKFLGMSPDNWRLSKREAGCGPMTATGIHLLNLAVCLAGPVQRVHAWNFNGVTGFESGDSASAKLLFNDGVIGSINAMLSTPFFSRFAVFGSNGWVEVHDNSHVEAPTGWTLKRSTKGGEISSVAIPVATPVKDNLEAFAASVEAGQSAYPISLQEMLDTAAVLEAVQRSSESDGAAITPARIERPTPGASHER